jgi:hypothetical protein
MYTANSANVLEVIKENPRPIAYAYGLQFLVVTLRMQYSHVVHEWFNPFRRTTIFAWCLCIAVSMGVIPKDNVENTFWVITIVSTLAVCHLIYHVISELKQILNVNVFVLKPETEPKKVETKGSKPSSGTRREKVE